jgi:hypothetical protein
MIAATFRSTPTTDPSPELPPCLRWIGIDVDDFVAAHLVSSGERQARAPCVRQRTRFQPRRLHCVQSPHPADEGRQRVQFPRFVAREPSRPLLSVKRPKRREGG